MSSKPICRICGVQEYRVAHTCVGFSRDARMDWLRAGGSPESVVRAAAARWGAADPTRGVAG